MLRLLTLLSISIPAWLRQDRQKKKKVSGVIVGAALCCLPGATLGSIYDDWRASKEAPEMERRAREHQAKLQTQRRCGIGSGWGADGLR